MPQLRAETDAVKQPGDGTDQRWSQIDYLILEGHRIQALQRIRDEFGGGIHDVLDLLKRLQPAPFRIRLNGRDAATP
ncbi:hypothetical protein OG607_44820 [Streptomyces sp. NBC_01537]|uniref:hypothetical protein n=1 Tax=Streptomyces sp. NBC_01537 TaxID=2903896 RepID=UPI00386F1359